MTGHFTAGAISVKVNGAVKQNANLNHRSGASPSRPASGISEAFELKAGDIISGTPENVGPSSPAI